MAVPGAHLLPLEIQRALTYALPREPRGIARLGVWTPMFINFSIVIEFVGWDLRGALACTSRTSHLTVAFLHHRMETQFARAVLLGQVPGITVHITD